MTTPTVPSPLLRDMRTRVDGRPISISVEMVGPVEAEKMLGKNTRNRRLKEQHIARLAADIEAGDWEFNGATICISSEPEVLLDGQNRLHAIIRAGLAVPTIVVRGLAHEAQDDIDTGASRKFHDVLTIRGEPNATSLAALVRRVGAWESGARRNIPQWKTTHSGLLRVLSQHPELREYIQPSRRVAIATGMNPSSIGMLWWAFDQIDVEDARFFFERVEDGQGPDGNPIRLLHRTLREETRRMKGGNAQVVRHIVFTIKAWNAYREGRSLGLLRWKPGGAAPEGFPEPV